MKNIKQIKIITMLMVVGLLSVGCSDYLDVDTDSDNPKTAPLNFLLTATQVQLAIVGDFNVNGGSQFATYTHSMTSREEDDQYGIKVDNIPMRNDWDDIYLNLNNLNSLISQGTTTGNMVYVGIAQIEKAYLMSIAVDLWGDVPYTEATNLVGGVATPSFDDQKAIYTSIFALIDVAKTNINSNLGSLKPGVDDLFYAGNRAKWIKFANTFKLKLYNQTNLLTTGFDQAGFNALIAENNFFSSNADDFQFNRNVAISPSNERNNLFRESYESTQFGSYQSPWFYEVLKGMNPNIHNGNPDPRLPYYIYNQIKKNVLPPDTTVGTNPNADYWDKSTGFFSIRFGSTGPNRDKSAENSYSYPGIFPCGGKYDDGLGGVVNGESGAKGKAPRRILTYDEFLYIQAELIQIGKLTTAGTAVAKLQQAMTASFAKVDQVVSLSSTTQVVPAVATSTAATTFMTKIVTEFNAASAAKKMEIIMTQKWVATFGDPLDQYNDYRRTGYPVLADPKGTSPEYQLNNADGFPLIDSQTVLLGSYQISLFWPQSELNANTKAPKQKDPTTYKIFWDN
jgi:Starch-binding associating with outer membrane